MKKKLEMKKEFVFFERTGRRWKYSKILICTVFLSFVTILGFIVKGLLQEPQLDALTEIENMQITPINTPIQSDEATITPGSYQPNNHSSKQEVYAFYQSKYHQSKTNKMSLTKHIDSIDVLVPDWYHLDANLNIIETNDEEVDKLARKNHIQLIPKIALEETADPSTLQKLLSQPNTRTKIIEQLYKKIKEEGYDGIHIGLIQVQYEDRDLFAAFMNELFQKFHSSNLMVTLQMPMNDATFDPKVLSNSADRMIIHAFDQHIEKDSPGPLASLSWTEKLIESFNGPREKLVVNLASYAYDWNVTSGKPATPQYFHHIMKLAGNHGLNIQWDEASYNPYVRYNEQSDEHIVWFLDGVTFYNQLMMANRKNVKGIGIWNIGSEDPSIWSALSNRQKNLETIPNLLSVMSSGSGDVFKVTKTEKPGKRQVVFRDGLIVNEIYQEYPTPYQFERYGGGQKKIAITFDDGPSPEYTNKVLEILKQYEVKAGFFVIGKNASLHPKLLKRIYDEGHEIGSHTFSHVNIVDISDGEMEFELNSTQRVIQAITGRSTLMFRPPYLATHNEGEETPSGESLRKIMKAEEMGYTLVGSLIDPRDWDGKSADKIFRKVQQAVQNQDGNIILLHDAGGDRSATLEALPNIIEWLKKEGYAIVPVSEMVGKNRGTFMPFVEDQELSLNPFYFVGSLFSSFFVHGWSIFLYSIIILGFVRLLVLLFYSLRQKGRIRKKEFGKNDYPFVSVLIAAYNEEKVIKQTIQTVLKSDYPYFEVIIVDDGSTDDTSKVIRSAFSHEPRVRLIVKRNGGKASALNMGFLETKGEIVVTLDADTIISEEAISYFVRHFADYEVGAVSGNVKIGNIKNLITLWQHVEYVTGFNLEKRAFNELHCIPVVPGAIGAWRKSAIARVGYFEEDTLAEDTDITIKLLRNGYAVRCEEKAIAFTEAPENIKGFVKQRYRWTYGILQCIWKHKRSLFSMKQKGLGFVAMPNLLFQYILQATAPFMDVLLLLGIIAQTPNVFYYYIGFLLLDVLVALFAFRLERENTKSLLTIFIQRFIYRQFFSYLVWKSLLFALKGGLMGWNKLQRTGNVKEPIKKANVGA